MSFYEKSISGLNWYDNFSSLLQTKLSPEETNRFCDIVAAVSPRMPVERNLKQAIQFYESALNKRPDFSSFMRSHIPNLRRAYLGEELQGPKVREFARAKGRT